jgi:hypothetical protein
LWCVHTHTPRRSRDGGSWRGPVRAAAAARRLPLWTHVATTAPGSAGGGRQSASPRLRPTVWPHTPRRPDRPPRGVLHRDRRRSGLSPPRLLRQAAASAESHATLFRGGRRSVGRATRAVLLRSGSRGILSAPDHGMALDHSPPLQRCPACRSRPSSPGGATSRYGSARSATLLNTTRRRLAPGRLPPCETHNHHAPRGRRPSGLGLGR